MSYCLLELTEGSVESSTKKHMEIRGLGEQPSGVEHVLISYVVPLLNEKSLSSKLVGGKACNLAKLRDVKGITTKPGLVITSNAYKIYARREIQPLLDRLNAYHDLEKAEIIQLLAEIKNTILEINISSIFDQLGSLDLDEYYAVRSSGTAEDGDKASFSGKFDTQLYVKGNEIIEEVKKVWASVFTLNNLEYCEANNIKLNEINMAVIIQEMSNPIAAGTIFIDANKTEIDVAFGLGDAVVKGDKPTDKVVLDSLKGHVVFTEISEKKTRLVYSEERGKIVEDPLLPHEQGSLSITSGQIQQLNEQIKLLKEAYPECKNGLDVEFSCDADGQIYILQVRAVTVPVLDNILQVDSKKSDSYFIGKGDPVSYYVKCGILAVCNTPKDAEEAIIAAQKKQQKIIIVTANTTSQWESAMRRSAGVIAETGSTNCHTAIACREMRISGITGYKGAMNHLKSYNGQEITLCGPSGKVYEGERTASKYLSACELKTEYTSIETEEIVPRHKHFEQALKAGMIREHDGKNYIGKPLTPTCVLINELDLAAHQWLEKELKLKKATYRITDDNILLMNFDDCHEWRIEIRTWSIKYHQDILKLRKKAEEEFFEASQSLELTESSMQRWFAAYKQKIGFDNIAFPIGEVLNGILHQAAERKGIVEPILSDLVPAEVSCMGHFELEQCHEELRQIQSLLQETKAFVLVKILKDMYSNARSIGYSTIARHEMQLIEHLKKLNLYKKCKEVATSYRIQEKDFSLTFLEPWFQASSTPWLRLLIESGKLTEPAPQPLSKRKKKYYPEDKGLRTTIELVASSKKLHMDGHHTKARGLWQFINKMNELSQNTGYPIDKLLNKSDAGTIEIINGMNAHTQPGLKPRDFSENQEEKFRKFEVSKKPRGSQQNKEIMSFCNSLPTDISLKKDGFKRTDGRIIFSPNNVGLPEQLEKYEDQMSDSEERLSKHKYRGEYVRPNRQDYTQHQIAVPDGRVVTMVDLTQNKPALSLLNSIEIGKRTTYSASYKWGNPAFFFNPKIDLHSEHYDKITRYSEIIDKEFIPGFSKKSISYRLSKLDKLSKKNLETGSRLVEVNLNTNSKTEKMSIDTLIHRLLNELRQEQHKLAMTGKASSIIYGKDGAAPKMQPVVGCPAKDQHEQFINDALLYIAEWIDDPSTPLNEQYLFEMSDDDLQKFLIDSEYDVKGQDIFYRSLTAARKFREYQRKPTLRADLDDGTVVEVSMNDSIDIPSQALMMITSDSNVTETNRPVNLMTGYRSLNTLLINKYSGRRQDIILSNLAYTQASSTQSIYHFHIMPVYNSEGLFMIPYLDSKEDQFGEFEDTSIKGVKVSYLNEDVQKEYYNLVKFRIDLNSNEAINLQIFEALNQKLQLWETHTGCDMTWVAKFSSTNNNVTICVELRAGINQYTQKQIDGFMERNLWNKIGFSEVMGKKYSMLSQNNLDEAADIYNKHPKLRKTMLATPLYCLQVSPNGAKTFYQLQEHEITSEKMDAQQIKDVVHIARLLQVYDAEIYTKTMAALYHLRTEEMNAFKELLNPTLYMTPKNNSDVTEKVKAPIIQACQSRLILNFT